MATKTAPKTETTPEVALVVAPPSPFANLLEQARNAAEKVKASITELTEVRQQLVDAQDQIDMQLVELRAMIGGGGNDERERSSTRASRGHGENGTLEDYCYAALKAAGKAGLNKVDTAKAVIEAGYTTTTTLDAFAGSCYVSGINKMMKNGWAEYFSVDGERAGRYRLTPAGERKK